MAEETISVNGSAKRSIGGQALAESHANDEPIETNDAGGDDAKSGRTASAEADESIADFGMMDANGEETPRKSAKPAKQNEPADDEADESVGEDDDGPASDAPEDEESSELADEPEAKAEAKQQPDRADAGNESFKLADSDIADLADIIGHDAVDKVIKPLIARINFLERAQKDNSDRNYDTHYGNALHTRIDRLNDSRYGADSEDMTKAQAANRQKLQAKAEALYKDAITNKKPISGPAAIKKAHALLTQSKVAGNNQTSTASKRARMVGVVEPKSSSSVATKKTYEGAIKNIDRKMKGILGQRD